MKLELSRQIFKRYLNIKFNENLSSEIRDVPSGRTYEQTERQILKSNSSFSQVYKRTKQHKMERKT